MSRRILCHVMTVYLSGQWHWRTGALVCSYCGLASIATQRALPKRILAEQYIVTYQQTTTDRIHAPPLCTLRCC